MGSATSTISMTDTISGVAWMRSGENVGVVRLALELSVLFQVVVVSRLKVPGPGLKAQHRSFNRPWDLRGHGRSQTDPCTESRMDADTYQRKYVRVLQIIVCV